MLTKQEQQRVAQYLKDYGTYLWNKQDKEFSAIVKLMIQNTIKDINEIAEKLQFGEDK